MNIPPTIFVVDPDESARGVVRAIADEMGLPCEEYQNAEDFLAAYKESRPGCLVAEFRLLGASGLELQQTLAADCIALPVLFVTRFADTRMTVQALQNGALTVLDKPVHGQDLWEAIRKALDLDRKSRRIDAAHDEVRQRLARLTDKERQVLTLMVEGKINKAIASKLDISLRTVEARRHQIFKKTKTDSVAQLVRLIVLSGVER